LLTEDGAPARPARDRSAEPLSLAHRPLIEPLLRALDLPLSEYSFANLYLFRAVHRYAVVLHPVPHLLGITYDGVSHAMPLLRFGPADVDTLLQCAACVYPVTEQAAEEAAAYGLRSHWNDDDSDYIYDSRKLAALEGRTLRSKRTQAAVFAARMRPVSTPLSAANVSDAQQVLELWSSQVDRPKTATDYDACREALLNFEALGLTGIMVNDGGGTPCGFLMAQGLGQFGMAVHFAKGDRSHAGVYPYMFSRFAAESGAAWLNFEQDLGKPGLRRAKRALDPARLIRKYRLVAGTT
jgi:hypothetical protein